MAEKPKILIIDDEEDIRDLYRSFLEGQNYEIDEAANGREAFQLASKNRYDLFITDILMPEMNGVEFMKVLKMIEPDSVVIIITGYDDMHYTREALEYGAFRYLTKPVNMKDFRTVVEMGLLEQSKLFHATTSEKLIRLKDKLNNNPELQKKIYGKLHAFLSKMKEKNISSLELGGPGCNGKIWIRRKKELIPETDDDLTINQDELNLMILSILNKNDIENLNEDKFLKFNYEFRKEREYEKFNFYIFFEQSNLVAKIKPIRTDLIQISPNDFPKKFFLKILTDKNPSGLLLITGPTGAGKSSFVDSIININNNRLENNIYIIGNSIEFYHESKKSIVRHIEINKDAKGLEDALVNVNDLDPDIVVIEEIKTGEVLRLVNDLIDSGVMVISTMKARSVEETLNRLITLTKSGINEHGTLRRTAYNLSLILSLDMFKGKDGNYYQTKEIMINNKQTQNIIINENINEMYQVLNESPKEGQYTKEKDLARYVKEGVLARRMAIEMANDRDQLSHLIKM